MKLKSKQESKQQADELHEWSPAKLSYPFVMLMKICTIALLQFLPLPKAGESHLTSAPRYLFH